MIDIHCHILFGADDGAQTIGEAIDMIKLAARCGTNAICVTPHSNIPGSFENYISDIYYERINILREICLEENVNVQLLCGQEIFCTYDTPDLLKEGRLITLNNSRYPLVEFDFGESSNSVYEKLKMLKRAGYTPIVAHPERYTFVQEDEGAPERLRSLSCLMQINKGSITGKFGLVAQNAAFSILRRELCSVIASDAHSPFMRTPNLATAYDIVSEAFGSRRAEKLFTENPRKILQNKDLL